MKNKDCIDFLQREAHNEKETLGQVHSSIQGIYTQTAATLAGELGGLWFILNSIIEGNKLGSSKIIINHIKSITNFDFNNFINFEFINKIKSITDFDFNNVINFEFINNIDDAIIIKILGMIIIYRLGGQIYSHTLYNATIFYSEIRKRLNTNMKNSYSLIKEIIENDSYDKIDEKLLELNRIGNQNPISDGYVYDKQTDSLLILLNCLSTVHGRGVPPFPWFFNEERIKFNKERKVIKNRKKREKVFNERINNLIEELKNSGSSDDDINKLIEEAKKYGYSEEKIKKDICISITKEINNLIEELKNSGSSDDDINKLIEEFEKSGHSDNITNSEEKTQEELTNSGHSDKEKEIINLIRILIKNTPSKVRFKKGIDYIINKLTKEKREKEKLNGIKD